MRINDYRGLKRRLSALAGSGSCPACRGRPIEIREVGAADLVDVAGETHCRRCGKRRPVSVIEAVSPLAAA